MPNPHDRLIRTALRKPSAAAAVLRRLLPAEDLANLDLDGLTLLPGTFIGPELDERRTDLLFEVPHGGSHPALLYVLLEHQRTVEARMALRLMRYVVRVCYVWVADHAEEPRALPAVSCLVIYNGSGPWTAPTELRALYPPREALSASLDRRQPGLEYSLIDLARVDDARLATGGLAGLALLLLKHVDNADLLDLMRAWREALRAVRRGPDGRSAIQTVITYLLEATRIPTPELGRVLGREILRDEGVETMTMTTGDQLRLEGRLQGREEGREEGRLESLRRMLGRQLAQRFGPPEPDLLRRLEAADVDALEIAVERILTATSVDDVLPG